MIKVKINGHEQNWDGDPDLPLLWFLRDEVGLTGTKFGCGQALCGACTVIVDKQAVRACITSVSDVVGREVTTIEGLHPTGDHAVQKAWRQVNVPQCGYCQAGQIMQAAALLAEIPNPTMIRYARRWRATSAAAAVTSASKMQSISPRRESDHEHLTNPDKLRGMEARVKPEGFPPLRSQEPRHCRRFCAGRAHDVAPGVCGLSDRRRQDAAWHRRRPAGLRRHRVRRNRDDRGTSVRDGYGRPHQPAPDRCRGDGGRLVACEGAAGAWRRGQIRQPGYRRFAQHPALSDPDARDRRIGAGHARSRRRQALERAGVRGQGRQSRGGSCRKRPPSRLRRPRRRCSKHRSRTSKA